MYQEDPLDRFCRIATAWMIFTERTISIKVWYLRKTASIEAWRLWKLSLMRCQFIVRRLWIRLYYRVISPVLLSIGLKRLPTWTELEEEVQEFEAQFGEPFARSPEHVAGLKREQAQKAKRKESKSHHDR